jgi:virginiamycin B lyase
VVASIVAVGVVGAIGLFASGALGHGPDAQSASPGFPRPTAVATASATLVPARAGRVTAWTLPEALVGPRDVAVTAEGVVWITEQNRGRVDALKDGVLTRYATDAFPYVGAFALSAGPGGTMWFTGYPGGSIARILPDGTANGFAPLSDASVTVAVAQGDGDAMWITDTQRSLLVRIGSDGTVSQLQIPRPPGVPAKATVQPRDIARGSAGRMWFTDPGTGSVGSVVTAGTPSLTEYPLGEGRQPRSIAVAPDGSPWITLSDQKALARIDPSNGSATVVRLPAADAVLNDLLVAPDGTIWVSEAGPFLLHVRADGSTIERIRLPGGVRYTDGIALAPDGTVWAAATDANTIVSVAPGP